MLKMQFAMAALNIFISVNLLRVLILFSNNNFMNAASETTRNSFRERRGWNDEYKTRFEGHGSKKIIALLSRWP